MMLRSGLFIVAALFAMAFMSSCTREYICECEISYSGKPGLPDTSLNRYTIEDTKKNAESLCKENSSESVKDGIKTVENCYLF
ncbi:MAG: hypothetical protein R2800_02245 [Flavipsychrobacter sp.]